MENQARRRLAPELGHRQCIDHKVSGHALAQRPADNLPAEQIDDHGKV